VRLFVALEIPAAVRDNLAAQVEKLRELSAKVADKRPRWVRSENLHVTLKFIGEVSPTRLAGIRGALSAIRSDALVKIKFHGLGFFPNEQHPRVLWAGLDASANLPSLAGDIDGALETQGIPCERRAFTPHLTLARIEPPGLHEKLRAAIQKNGERAFGSFQAREFHLIESKLKPSGAEYTTLASYSFMVEA
jgi:RNA 2',3'-cyclic 3'-phosphodiesterase